MPLMLLTLGLELWEGIATWENQNGRGCIFQKSRVFELLCADFPGLDAALLELGDQFLSRNRGRTGGPGKEAFAKDRHRYRGGSGHGQSHETRRKKQNRTGGVEHALFITKRRGAVMSDV